MLELERLAALSALEILDSESTVEFDVLTQLASQIFSVPMAAVSFIDERRMWYKASIGVDFAEVPRDVGFCTHTIKHPDTLLYVPDATRDPRFANNPLVTGCFGLRFYAGATVLGPTGHPLGTICVMDRKPRHVQLETISLLKLLAASVTTAIKLHVALRSAHQPGAARVTRTHGTPASVTPDCKAQALVDPQGTECGQANTAVAGASQTTQLGAPSISNNVSGPSSIEDSLRSALMSVGDAPFKLAVQPIFTLDTGRLTGFEALVRWPDPVSGRERPPSEFLPIAEATGLVVPLDRWVCNQACRIAAKWPAQLTVSTNVSAANFLASGFVDDVRSALQRNELSPERLKLEITEIALVREPARVRQVIAELQELGLKVVVDDFGSGNSAMAYLRDYAFDGLKIDRSFTAGIETDSRKLAVVQMIVDMARSTAMTVTVEGVETKGQLNLLRATGVDCVQGFLLGRPAAPDMFSQLIAAGAVIV